MHECSLFFTSSPAFILCRHFDDGHSNWHEMIPHCILICISLTMSKLDSGKQTLGGHKQNVVCTRTQEKGAMIPRETDPDLPGSVQESPVEAWVDGGLLQGGGQ